MTRLRLLLLFLLFLSAPPARGAASPLPQAPQGSATTLYMPFVQRGCQPGAEERALAQRIAAHPEQQRPSFVCHPILEQVARAHAQYMAASGQLSHLDASGTGPNARVRQAGYPLPSWYSLEPAANNIQSIAGGYPTAEAVFNAWLASSGHRPHVLGLDPFWAEQVEYGIGFAANPASPHGQYWVLLTARREP